MFDKANKFERDLSGSAEEEIYLSGVMTERGRPQSQSKQQQALEIHSKQNKRGKVRAASFNS